MSLVCLKLQGRVRTTVTGKAEGGVYSYWRKAQLSFPRMTARHFLGLTVLRATVKIEAQGRGS